MPQQEVFFEQQMGDCRIEVLKTYDQKYAYEAFQEIDEVAQSHLWDSLKIEENFDPTDIPAPNGPDRAEFLWEALLIEKNDLDCEYRRTANEGCYRFVIRLSPNTLLSADAQ